jgi:hypothetical protein
MGGICYTYGNTRNAYKILVRKRKRSRIVLKWAPVVKI